MTVSIYSDNINFNAESFYRYKIRYQELTKQSAITYEHMKVPNSNEFYGILRGLVSSYSNFDGGLLLHLNIHGDKNKKGFVLKSNELLPCAEVINHLRILNLTLKNELHLTMTMCFGRYLV